MLHYICQKETGCQSNFKGMKNKIVKPVGSIRNITLQEMMNTGWQASLGPL